MQRGVAAAVCRDDGAAEGDRRTGPAALVNEGSWDVQLPEGLPASQLSVAI